MLSIKWVGDRIMRFLSKCEISGGDLHEKCSLKMSLRNLRNNQWLFWSRMKQTAESILGGENTDYLLGAINCSAIPSTSYESRHLSFP